MKLQEAVTISGTGNVATFVTRLRAAADQAEEVAAAMLALGSTPATIVGGNNVSFTFTVEATK